MNNIIFLDFDGVINNSFDKINLSCIRALHTLINLYDAKIVVISSILGSATINKKRYITKYLNKLGFFNIDFIDPNFEGDYLGKEVPARLLGIIDYLKNNPECSYVILDDEYERNYKRLGLNHYKTKMFQGLQKRDIPKIVFKKSNDKIYSHIKYYYRTLYGYEAATNNLVKTLKLIKDKYN